MPVQLVTSNDGAPIAYLWRFEVRRGSKSQNSCGTHHRGEPSINATMFAYCAIIPVVNDQVAVVYFRHMGTPAETVLSGAGCFLDALFIVLSSSITSAAVLLFTSASSNPFREFAPDCSLHAFN